MINNTTEMLEWQQFPCALEAFCPVQFDEIALVVFCLTIAKLYTRRFLDLIGFGSECRFSVNAVLASSP